MERFVVGTGRCGSTLLSRMLGACPDVLSLFEFFTGLDMGRRFAPEPIPGDALAELIGAEQPFVTAVLRRGYRVEEITYPFDDPARRFRPEDPLPWILVSTLPRMDADPDALFDAVLARARRQPAQRPDEHYRALFDWLCERFGKSVWIERSGSSIDYAAALIAAFPDARFVHLQRDGREVALSMRVHHAYRLPISLLYDAPLDGGLRVSELPPLDFDAPPTSDDTISRILAARPPPEYFGRYWSDQIARGVPALRALGADRVLDVRFEDLIEAPRPQLGRIADFFELGAERAWIDAAADLIRGVPGRRFDALEPAEAARLDEACAIGRAHLDGTPP